VETQNHTDTRFLDKPQFLAVVLRSCGLYNRSFYTAYDPAVVAQKFLVVGLLNYLRLDIDGVEVLDFGSHSHLPAGEPQVKLALFRGCSFLTS
jgi:hypothetical protein